MLSLVYAIQSWTDSESAKKSQIWSRIWLEDDSEVQLYITAVSIPYF